MTFKRVTSAVAGDTTHFGGLDVNKFSDYLGGTDIGGSETVDIATLTAFRNSKFTLRNPANTFSYVFVPSAIAASRNVTLPLLTADDTAVTAAFAQTLTNKTIDALLNTIPNINRTATYVIFKDGSNYCSRTTATGATATNASFTTLIQNIINGISPAGTATLIDIAPGDYEVTANTTITIDSTRVGNIHIRGQGAGITNIVADSATTVADMISIKGDVKSGSADLPLTANATAGDFTVTMSSGNAATLVTGDYVLIRSTAVWSSSVNAVGRQGEIKRVLSVSGTTVTFEKALHDSYTTANTAVVRELTMLNHIMISNLTLIPEAGYAGTGTLLKLYFVDEFQLNNVELRNSVGQYSAGIFCVSCTNSSINNPITTMDASVTYNLQYGISIAAACENIAINNLISKGRWRHVIVAANGLNETNTQGICRNIQVNNAVAEGAQDTTYDTHLEGEGIQFNNCTTLGQGVATDGSGFNIRSRKTDVNSCTVVNAVEYGVMIFEEASNCHVQGGRIRKVQRTAADAAGYGVYVQTNITDVFVNGVEISECGAHGIFIDPGTHRTKITNCIIRNNAVETTGYGLSVSNSAINDLHIANNIITGNTAAINAANTSSNGWVITNNSFTPNTGLSTINGTNHIIFNNEGLTGFDYTVPTMRTLLKYGAHTHTSNTAATGVLSAFVTAAAGTHTYSYHNTLGGLSLYTTGTTSGNQAGFRCNSTLTRRARNSILYAQFWIDTTSSCLIFIGFHSTPATLVSGTDPLNAKSGVMLTTNGGNFRVAHNDGSGATVFDDFSPTRTVNTSTYMLKIIANDTAGSYYVEINDGTTLYSKTLTTDIPAQATGLGGTALVETATTAARTLNLSVFEGMF